MLTNRRQFLLSAAALPLAGRAFAAERATVVDTHLHCFAGKDDKRFPYHKDGPYAPEEASTPEHLLECMKGAGVDYAIVVHPEPYQDDHRYLEHCLTVGKDKLKGTCLFFAGRPDNEKRMRELAKKVPIEAARIHAYNPDRLPPFEKAELRDFWKMVADLGMAIQLHMEPRYAPGFEPLIKEFKSVRVMVDHLGRPFQGTPKEHAVVIGWSKYTNVRMKLSAVPDKKTYPHRDPAEVVKDLTKAFGAERLMYGGGYGPKATGDTYRAERERIAGLLAHLSAADRDLIYGINAARFFRFRKD